MHTNPADPLRRPIMLEQDGIVVYGIWRHDQPDTVLRQYWVCTDLAARDEGDGAELAIDVRDLPNGGRHSVNTETGRCRILSEAIRAGLLR